MMTEARKLSQLRATLLHLGDALLNTAQKITRATDADSLPQMIGTIAGQDENLRDIADDLLSALRIARRD